MSDLRRELGFWDALTIGAGTMIGAGIFLLAGIALDMSDPAAIFAYLAAGIVCMITASSAAELATGMPTSGGDYFFVSWSLGPAFGAIWHKRREVPPAYVALVKETRLCQFSLLVSF